MAVQRFQTNDTFDPTFQLSLLVSYNSLAAAFPAWSIVQPLLAVVWSFQSACKAAVVN